MKMSYNDNLINETDIPTPDEKVYKTKDYIRRATNNYRRKKYSEDPEFKEQQLAKNREFYQQNKDKYKEKRSIYMKAYYQRKKAEKKVQTTTDIENSTITENLENLNIV